MLMPPIDFQKWIAEHRDVFVLEAVEPGEEAAVYGVRRDAALALLERR